MKLSSAAVLFLTLGGALAARQASATFVSVALPTVNNDIRTYTDGSAYEPLYPTSSQTLGGIPFQFQTVGNGNDVFIGGTLTMPVSIGNAGTVYTLINTAFGSYGQNVGSITFNASGGLTYTVQLVEGVNVRDHYYDGFVNTTTDPNTTENVWGSGDPGNAHLDMQTFVLPVAFDSATLTSIVFDSTGDNTTGEPFLAGVTVDTAVPEPSTLVTGAFMLLPFGAGALRRLRRRSIANSR